MPIKHVDKILKVLISTLHNAQNRNPPDHAIRRIAKLLKFFEHTRFYRSTYCSYSSTFYKNPKCYILKNRFKTKNSNPNFYCPYESPNYKREITVNFLVCDSQKWTAVVFPILAGLTLLLLPNINIFSASSLITNIRLCVSSNWIPYLVLKIPL